MHLINTKIKENRNLKENISQTKLWGHYKSDNNRYITE